MATVPTAIALPGGVDTELGVDQGVGLPASPAPGIYHFTRWFYVPKATLCLVSLWLNGPGTVQVGPDLAGLTTVLTPEAGVVVHAQIHLAKGANRVDIAVTPAGAECFGMRLYQPEATLYDGTTIGWVYDVGAPVADVDMAPALPSETPVFSILPDWSEPITETVGYLTDIATSETAHENPRIVRHKPRRTFEAQFLRQAEHRMRMDAFFVGVGTGEFWLPLWHEQYYLGAGMPSGATSVTFPAGTLALREFQVGDTVFVNAGDPSTFELLQVLSIDFDTDVLTWVSGPAQSWAPGARIIPCRLARLLDSIEMDGPTDTIFIGRLRFTLSRPEYRFPPTWGPGGNMWTFRINRAEDMGFAYASAHFIGDNRVSQQSVTPVGTRALVTTRASLALIGRSEMVNFRRFIEMAAGRHGKFYMPTHMHDVQLRGTTITGTSISAVPAGFSEFIKVKKAARSALAFWRQGVSSVLVRDIVSVSVVGGDEVFALADAIPTIDISQILRIQFLVLSRFDQDTFEFSHPVDESMGVLTSVATRSVDDVVLI